MAQSDGFQKHPENINRKGAPKKHESLTNLMREFLHNKEISVADSDKKIAAKDAFIQKVYEKAMKGDAACIKLIWNYIEGMPIQYNVNDNTHKVKEFPNLILDDGSETKPD